MIARRRNIEPKLAASKTDVESSKLAKRKGFKQWDKIHKLIPNTTLPSWKELYEMYGQPQCLDDSLYWPTAWDLRNFPHRSFLRL